MNLSERINHQIMTLILTAKNRRLRPKDVEWSLADKLGVSVSTIKEALKVLINKGLLVYTYRNPFDYVEIPAVEGHNAVRPMKVVIDDKGEPWLCDSDVEPSKDLVSQGCWRCGEIPFTRDD